ncbi:class I SAM-dependent methyltransferase [Micromonospora sp. DT227]|uniref:class I SAM-dependent methyltransferase n=1 Tax=Micromonospora sp. DT227 TaxID=3393433 RepID=UPI003CEABA03
MNKLMDFYDPGLYELNVGHAPRVGDAYREQLAPLGAGIRIMELGCGIGDVLLPLVSAGAYGIGVDNSPEMLRHFAGRLERLPAETARRVELVDETLPALPAREAVDAVLLPNDLVAHVLGDDDVDTMFRNAHRALRPDGVLILDMERFDVTFLASVTGPDGGLTRTHGFFDYPDDRLLRVDEQSRYDPVSGLMNSTFRYQILNSEAVVEQTRYRTLRQYPRRPREVTRALELAGFEVTDVHESAFPPGLDHVMVVARARRSR